MKYLIVNVIFLSCVSLYMCQSDLLTDEFAAPTSSLSESHYSHALQAHYDDTQSDYSVSQSSRYRLPSPKLRLITKNVYVHIPPDEPEFQSVQTIEKPIPKKHYNIIFIKAPTSPTPTLPAIPEPTQDKTLVYVLVKKPEPLPKFEISQAANTERPEVFFVKYKGGIDQ